MPEEPPPLPPGFRYVLTGRLVTLGDPGVVPRGAVYVDANRIAAVQRAGDPPPPGFEQAPRIHTGDTIYPGLIELHNHLSYNAMPLWDVPLKYTNSGQWKNHPDYRRLITKPAQILGRTAGVVEAVVRFVECKCLLGGVTTTQGITLASASGITSIYRGLVRNVEQPDDPQLPRAGTRIANPDTGKAGDYLNTLRRHTCYLQHLSEGVDATARDWFHRLRLADGGWAVTEAFCGIHSTALNEDDLRVVSDRGGSMVWSPLSNLLLYGRTVDIRAAKEAGILIGIGCDWAPSGSKNLLGELKTAWLVSEEAGGVFSPAEIVAMATTNAARILKWESHLGSIEPGKRADLICIDGQRGDDHLRLIHARETALTLVVIDGVPRVGQRSLMEAFPVGTESIRVGRSNRVLNLAEAGAHPLVRGLSLSEATRRLTEAMRDLPALAQQLDGALAHGLFAGSVDPAGTAWRVVPDFEEEDQALEAELGLASLPLAEFAQPMELEPITVADDAGFFRKLVAARNLPEFVKKGLPPLYGSRVPTPPGAEFLREAPEPLPPEVGEAQELKSVLRISGELSLEDRRRIVDQALLLLEEHYVHLPFKRAMHAVDPVQRLRLLRHELEHAHEETLPPEIVFHNEVTRAFNSLRDLHTTFRLPSPFREKTAWLPFFIEEIREQETTKYIVTKIIANAGPATFEPGVEVLHWNGTPIRAVVEQNGDRQPGGNAAARHARGLNSLTIRPLVQGLPPDEEWVTLRYRGLDGVVQEWTQEWLVFEPGRSLTSLNPESLLAEATAIGMDAQTDDVQEAKRLLFAGRLAMAERATLPGRDPAPVANTPDGLATSLPMVFRARSIPSAHGRFGYIRIFTFNVRSAREFVDEFVRLAAQLPRSGLILDVRGNGGGLIHAAEQLLQVLTPHRIEPQPAQFINTPMNLALCRAFRHPIDPLPHFTLGEWLPSMEQAVQTGATFSSGIPITPPDAANDRGQVCPGPVVLITDALCYSATDIFAAGFQDHGIGPILGVHENTGAGGANVWSHRLLLELIRLAPESTAAAGSRHAPLPHGSDLRVAVRRMLRVGRHAGDVLEDLGVVPNQIHAMTRDDVLQGNVDLIDAAAQILSAMEDHAVSFTVENRAGNRVIRVQTRHVDWITLLVNRRPQGSYDMPDGTVELDLAGALDPAAAGAMRVEIQGFVGDRLVAAARGSF